MNSSLQSLTDLLIDSTISTSGNEAVLESSVVHLRQCISKFKNSSDGLVSSTASKPLSNIQTQNENLRSIRTAIESYCAPDTIQPLNCWKLLCNEDQTGNMASKRNSTLESRLEFLKRVEETGKMRYTVIQPSSIIGKYNQSLLMKNRKKKKEVAFPSYIAPVIELCEYWHLVLIAQLAAALIQGQSAFLTEVFDTCLVANGCSIKSLSALDKVFPLWSFYHWLESLLLHWIQPNLTPLRGWRDNIQLTAYQLNSLKSQQDEIPAMVSVSNDKPYSGTFWLLPLIKQWSPQTQALVKLLGLIEKVDVEDLLEQVVPNTHSSPQSQGKSRFRKMNESKLLCVFHEMQFVTWKAMLLEECDKLLEELLNLAVSQNLEVEDVKQVVELYKAVSYMVTRLQGPHPSHPQTKSFVSAFMIQ
eukprot:Platyproteum_vivax@DN15851_c0_g1_i1.p1